MIVKVQVAFNEDSVLVYDEKREFLVQWVGPDIPQKIGDTMSYGSKKFFHAEIKGDKLNILEEAPWQEW